MSDCCLLFHWTSLGESGPKGADGNPGPQGRQLAHETYPFTTIDPVNDYCLCPQGPLGPIGPTGKMVNYDPLSIYFSFQFYFVWPLLEVCTVFRALLPKRCSRYACQRQASLIVHTQKQVMTSQLLL